MTVIEVSGGSLVAVYNDTDEDVVLLDWDDCREDEEGYEPVPVVPRSLADMPEDTRRVFGRY